MSRLLRSVLVGLAFAMAVAVAGCADEEGGSETSGKGTPTEAAPKPGPKPEPKIRPPEAAQSIDQTMATFLATLEQGDCAQLAEFMLHPSVRERDVRGKPPTEEECADLERRADAFPEQFEPHASQTFSTAAVVDGEAEDTPVSLVWLLDEERTWKFAGAFPGTDAQADTQPVDEVKFDANVSAWIEAVRTRDCDSVWRYFTRDSRFVLSARDRKRRLCKGLRRAYREPGTFRELLKNPDADPAKLGTTSNFGFYALSFPSGRFATIVVATAPKGGKKKKDEAEHEPIGVWDAVVAREADRK